MNGGFKTAVESSGSLSFLGTSAEASGVTWTDELAAFSALATTLIALIAVVGAAWQLRSTRAIHIAESRPYVVPSLVFGETYSGQAAVYLRLENHGRTPALNVMVEFPVNVTWNGTRNGDFQFTPEMGGVFTIAPGSSYEYFLGPNNKSSVYLKTLESGVDVVVRCESPLDAPRHADTYRLTTKNKFAKRQ